MAADMHIHVLTGDVTEADLAEFFSNSFGSQWFNLARYNPSRWDAACTKVEDTPSVHVGEVSWLSAAVTGETAAYVPDPIMALTRLIGERLPVIDDALIGQATAALLLPNQTGYSLNNAEAVLRFLVTHKGQRCFTVSW